MRNQQLHLSWTQQSLNSYLAVIKLEKSPQTVLAYKYDVGKFLEYLTERKVKKASGIKPTHITDYLGHCKDQGKSDATLSRYYMSISSYCSFLRRTKEVTFNLMEDLKAPRSTQKPPKVLTKEEVERMLDLPDLRTEMGVKNKAILELFYSSGLRVSEICNLDLEDFLGDSIRTTGKRGKTRTIPMTDPAIKAMKAYLDEYRNKEDGPLFLTHHGLRLNRQRVSEMVGQYARQIGIKGVTAHTLRHSCATHLLDEGADIRFIQEVLGHSSIGSTQRYTHLSSNKMQDMFRQFHPRKGRDE